MRLPLAYLACPYSDPDPKVRERRWVMVTGAMACLMKDRKRVVYSPITSTHFLVDLGIPLGWDFWEAPSLQMLERCDCLIVLGLEGWKSSVGVQAELAHARALNIPTYFLPSYTDLEPIPFRDGPALASGM